MELVRKCNIYLQIGVNFKNLFYHILTYFILSIIFILFRSTLKLPNLNSNLFIHHIIRSISTHPSSRRRSRGMLVKQKSAKNRWRDKAETVEKKIEMNRVGISGICPWLFSTEQTKTEGFDSLSPSLVFPSLSCNLEISISSRSSRYFNEADIPCRRCRKDTGPPYVHQRQRVQQANEGWNDRPCVEGTKMEATAWWRG